MAGYCTTCGQALKEGARFCGKCGEAIGTSADISRAATHRSDSTPQTFGWNWGAFLLPGIWLIGHRIRPNVAGMVCLGLPFLGALLSLVVNLFRWKGDSSPEGGLLPLEFATVTAGWLLGIYIAACLFSFRTAKEGSALAYENVGGGDVVGFMGRQRTWAVIGGIVAVIHVAILIGLATVYFPSHDAANRFPAQSLSPTTPGTTRTSAGNRPALTDGERRITGRWQSADSGSDGYRTQIRLNRDGTGTYQASANYPRPTRWDLRGTTLTLRFEPSERFGPADQAEVPYLVALSADSQSLTLEQPNAASVARQYGISDTGLHFLRIGDAEH